MGRRKLETGLIENRKTRNRTFINRKNGIVKKANELSKLCDVDVGVIIFGPNAGKPHVWPQESHEINHILRRYQSSSQGERRKRAINVLSDGQKPHPVHYKGQDEIRDDHIDGFSIEQLVELMNCLDDKLGIVQERIDMLERNRQPIHVEEVQSYGGEKQEMMVMNTSMETNTFHWDYQPDDHQQVEQRSAEELMMMMMMMMSGGSFHNLINGCMGDCIGLMGMETQGNHENQYLGQTENVNGGGMWNHPPPLTWFYAPFTQLQQPQAHLQRLGNDSQLPFYH